MSRRHSRRSPPCPSPPLALPPSGARTVRGAITKTGNAHLRRVLVESAWHYRHHPFLGDALRHHQRGAPPTVIDHAWLAQRRLHRRYRRLAARGKPKQLIVTAVEDLVGKRFMLREDVQATIDRLVKMGAETHAMKIDAATN